VLYVSLCGIQILIDLSGLTIEILDPI